MVPLRCKSNWGPWLGARNLSSMKFIYMELFKSTLNLLKLICQCVLSFKVPFLGCFKRASVCSPCLRGEHRRADLLKLLSLEPRLHRLQRANEDTKIGEVRTDGWVAGWLGGWVDGWMGGWMDGRLDG